MYPEDAPAPEPLPDYYGGGYGGGLKDKLVANFEGLIPLILIIIIGFFLAAKFGIITSGTPVVGQ